jgi:hypothetical protein
MGIQNDARKLSEVRTVNARWFSSPKHQAPYMMYTVRSTTTYLVRSGRDLKTPLAYVHGWCVHVRKPCTDTDWSTCTKRT